MHTPDNPNQSGAIQTPGASRSPILPKGGTNTGAILTLPTSPGPSRSVRVCPLRGTNGRPAWHPACHPTVSFHKNASYMAQSHVLWMPRMPPGPKNPVLYGLCQRRQVAILKTSKARRNGNLETSQIRVCSHSDSTRPCQGTPVWHEPCRHQTKGEHHVQHHS